ncbi:uncharacterized protein LOC104898309 isoform X2 [Beta vulgaris subsp. vulgaris]|uniref:uncharacterized protein LOC104898309 isoform X2 n=1 Tax=Beta vulgaris subsp. vulgaris TaxID=3555 RepID=UPI002546F2F9|nr:uncharacterized protein LOC104898309 isoform X2 [Beta vulgaris subsp. vulgaris]
MEVMVLMQVLISSKMGDSSKLRDSHYLFWIYCAFFEPKNSGSCEEHCDCSYCCCTAGVLYGCFRIVLYCRKNLPPVGSCKPSCKLMEPPRGNARVPLS